MDVTQTLVLSSRSYVIKILEFFYCILFFFDFLFNFLFFINMKFNSFTKTNFISTFFYCNKFGDLKKRMKFKIFGVPIWYVVLYVDMDGRVNQNEWKEFFLVNHKDYPWRGKHFFKFHPFRLFHELMFQRTFIFF